MIPTNLKIVRDKYVNGLRKLKNEPENYVIDENAVVFRDGISLQDNFQPVRYDLYLSCYLDINARSRSTNVAWPSGGVGGGEKR